MANINAWLRQKEKLILVFLCAFIMVAWVGGVQIFQLFDSGPVPGGTVFGKSVSGRELVTMARRLQAFYGGRSVPEVVLLAKTWEIIMMGEEARRHGIRVGDEPVRQFLQERFPAKSGDGVDEPAYLAHLEQSRMAQADYEKIVRALLAAQFVEDAVARGVNLPKEEAWLWYSRENEQVKARYLQLRAENLASLVAVKEDDLKALYAKHADTPRSTTPGLPGYQDPEKVTIEYVMAPYGKYADAAKITDDQIKAYYEANKEKEFLAPEREEREDTKPDKTGDKKKKSPEGEKAAAPKGQTKAEKEAGKKEAGPACRPLAEVKDEIVKNLRKSAGERKADAVMNKVNEAIWEALDTHFGSDKVPTIDMQQLAAKHALEYRRIARYFGADEVGTVLPGAYKLREKVFAQGTSSIGVPKPPMKADKGVFICQITDSRPPQPAKYETVRDKVEKDFRSQQGFQLAKEITSAAALEKDLDAAARIVEEKLGQCMKEGGIKPEKDKDAKSFYERGESKLFSRPRTYQGLGGRSLRYHYETGLPGRHNHADFADAAFNLKDGQVGMVAEAGAALAGYVLQRTETKPAARKEFDKNLEQILRETLMKKREAVVKTWRADVRRRARPSAEAAQYLGAAPE